MAHPTAVILVVGLNRSLLAHAPRLKAFAEQGALRTLRPVLPAVTCSVQSSMLTGAPPREHGIVGNGWYNRELAEVQFWKQSNRLVGGEKVWETARKRDPSITCAMMFWWHNMYSTVDFSVTPRPMYKADGRKIPDCYADPPELRNALQAKLGRFPLFNFWGPMADIRSSRWIADASIEVHKRHEPTLTLVYLPHLDYALQKLGPDHADIPKTVVEIDAVCGDLIDHFDDRGVRLMFVSEYGIEPVDDAVHVNRMLREEGLLRVREEEGLELLDAGASQAFAVADHQVAHVYVRDRDRIGGVADFCRRIPGVEKVLDRQALAALEIDHPRAGDLLLVSEPRRWFSYYYWLDDARAPDFARTVDIHRKAGYDPAELFLDPGTAAPKLKVAWKLFKRKLGFRTLLDVIPLDARLIRGSHGRVEQPKPLRPVLITARDYADHADTLACQSVRNVILEHLFCDTGRSA
ncbi:MAG: alkaline phosphatase family protein [Planctomycetes bacterium]|nr:alkaline phosphatase family protein [Planctomycetota bacterium]